MSGLRVKRMPKKPDIKKAVASALNTEMIMIQREAMLNVSDNVLNVRTGRLRNSIEVKVDVRGDKVRGVIAAGGSGVVYARIHEQGGTITPKTAKALTIPLDAAKTAAGVVRGGARSFPNTFLLKRKGKDPLIMQRRGKEIVPLFVLKKRVTIPERPYLRPAIDKRLGSLKKRVAREIKRAAS